MKSKPPITFAELECGLKILKEERQHKKDREDGIKPTTILLIICIIVIIICGHIQNRNRQVVLSKILGRPVGYWEICLTPNSEVER